MKRSVKVKHAALTRFAQTVLRASAQFSRMR
jgi:hypothetical protein